MSDSKQLDTARESTLSVLFSAQNRLGERPVHAHPRRSRATVSAGHTVKWTLFPKPNSSRTTDLVDLTIEIRYSEAQQ